MSFPWMKMVTIVFSGALATAWLLSSCAVHIGAIAPADAGAEAVADVADVQADSSTEDGIADAMPCPATCDADTVCCGSAPRCNAANTCVARCSVAGGQCTMVGDCCGGLYCDNNCRVCFSAGATCGAYYQCCSGICAGGRCS